MKKIWIVIAVICLFFRVHAQNNYEVIVKGIITELQEGIRMGNLSAFSTKYMSPDFTWYNMSGGMAASMFNQLTISTPGYIYDRYSVTGSGDEITVKFFDFSFKKEDNKMKLVKQNGQYLIKAFPMVFEMNVSMSGENKAGDVQQDLTGLQELKGYNQFTGPRCTVYYKDEKLKTVAERLGSLHGLMMNFLENEMKIPVFLTFNYILIEVSESQPLKLSIPVLPVRVPATGNPFDSKDFILTALWAECHETVEISLLNSLKVAYNGTRWYREGMSDYCAYTFVKRNFPDIASAIKADRFRSYENIRGRANLLAWQSGEPDPDPSVEKYGATFKFYLDLADTYGTAIFPLINSRIAAAPGCDGNTIVNIFSAVTKEDIGAKIMHY